MKRQITENLDIDLISEMWCCRHCDAELISARDNYKKGCLVSERNPTEIYRPVVEGEYSLAPNPKWTAVVEFYCPSCGIIIESEMLPLGHPLTYDIEIDVDALKRKYLRGPA
jgi:acetone carboxylase gamma subunit